jgi:hypothetical protein
MFIALAWGFVGGTAALVVGLLWLAWLEHFQ